MSQPTDNSVRLHKSPSRECSTRDKFTRSGVMRLKGALTAPARRWTGTTLLWLMALLAPSMAAALSGDRQQPIHIRADSVEINEKTGVSVYTGDVNVTQGSMELTADQLIVYRKNGEMDRMESKGRPATFRQQPDGAEQEVRGQARRIEYDAETQKAYLIGEGHVWRGKDEFLGERIVYDTVDSIVQATGGEDGEKDARVHAVIQPKKDQEKGSP